MDYTSKEGVWVTKAGKKMKPEEFNYGHLVNTIRMIERSRDSIIGGRRRRAEAGYLVVDGLGDKAQYLLEQELEQDDRLTDKEWLKKYCYIYCLLCEELGKRQLKHKKEKESSDLKGVE